MKIDFRITMAAVVVCAISTLASAAPTQVGNVYVGTCDSVLQNTQQNEVDVYDATGQFVTALRGPRQNACLTGMTFDTSDHFHVISAQLGTQWGSVSEFDNAGDLLANPGPFNGPASITHDLLGNLYLGQGNIMKIDRNGNVTSYAVAGGAVWIDLGPDQRTMFYTTPRGDIKSFDVVSLTQGPDIAVNAVARNVRALADGTIMFDSNGTVQKWAWVCDGCLYKEKFTYQIPANADSFTLDPDGLSLWSINTYYDFPNQLGHANVYRTDIKTGDPLGSFSLPPLTNGRYYSMSIGVNGDGMGSSASVTPSIEFPSRTVGTTSNPRKAVVTNTGLVQVVVTNITVTGDFAVSKTSCGKPVKSGLWCNVVVTFSPTQLGTRTGTLRIFDNAGSSPQTVTLTGVGK